MTAPTMDTMMPVLDRLISVYAEPFGVDLAVMLDTWTKALRGTNADDVEHVVEQWIQRESRWPKPAEIREFALHRRVVREREERPRGPDERCPQCRRIPFVAGFDTGKHVLSRVRCGCPQASERWQTEAALAHVDADGFTPPRNYRPDLWDRIPGRKHD